AEQRKEIVDFFVPGLDPARRAEVGRDFIDLYAHLYDEDVWMMSERQAQLDALHLRGAEDAAAVPIVLGSLSEVRARLPITIQSGGRKFRIVESGGELIAYSTVC